MFGTAGVWRGGEWMRVLGLGFTDHVRTGDCWACVWVLVVWVV